MQCPYCKNHVQVDYQLCENPHANEGAALFLCNQCGGASMIDNNDLRLPTEAEVQEIKHTPELWEPIAKYLSGQGLGGFCGYRPEKRGI